MITYKSIINKIEKNDKIEFNIIYESGTKPDYINRVLKNLIDIEGIKKVRDDTIKYKKYKGNLYLVIFPSCNTSIKELNILEYFDEKYITNNNFNNKNIHNNNIINKELNKNIHNKNYNKELNIKNYIYYIILIVYKFLKDLFLNIKKFINNLLNTYKINKENLLIKKLMNKNFTFNTTKNILNSFKKEPSKIELENYLQNLLKFPSKTYLENKKENLRLEFIIGSNGVGKSSFISKYLYFLLKNKVNVTVIAADTYRSGAIEQLRKYIDRIQSIGKVRLMKSMYGQNETKIVEKIVKNIINENYNNKKDIFLNKDTIINNFYLNNDKNNSEFVKTDLILVDTAGRNPFDKNLMNSLKKLLNFDRYLKINSNLNLTIENILVTEAISGQSDIFLEFFNNVDIKNVVLTKIDTVGDKLGTVFEMCYKNKYIICFSIGQSNLDIKFLKKGDEIEVIQMLDL